MKRSSIEESVREAFRNYSDVAGIKTDHGLIALFVGDIMRSFDIRVKSEVNRILKEDYGENREDVKEIKNPFDDYISSLRDKAIKPSVSQLHRLKEKSKASPKTQSYSEYMGSYKSMPFYIDHLTSNQQYEQSHPDPSRSAIISHGIADYLDVNVTTSDISTPIGSVKYMTKEEIKELDNTVIDQMKKDESSLYNTITQHYEQYYDSIKKHEQQIFFGGKNEF